MNLKLVVVTVFSVFILGAKAQDNHVQEYASFLVDIEKSMDKKAMSKTWKKRKSAWEQEILSVSTIDELNKLSDEFASSLSPKMVPSGSVPKLKFSNDYQAYGKDLSKFAGALPEEASDINSNDFRTTVLAVGQEFKDKEMQAQARKVKSQIKSDFTPVFKAVFEDSKRGSFAKIAGEKINDQSYTSTVKMELADDAKINIDEEKIYTYKTEVKLTNDLAIAKSVIKDMVATIKANTPTEYIESEWLDETYVDRTIYQYEFEAEIFSVTAKKPTVAIGLVKKSDIYYVVWSVTEPVFKNWKVSNRDWNGRDGK